MEDDTKQAPAATGPLVDVVSPPTVPEPAQKAVAKTPEAGQPSVATTPAKAPVAAPTPEKAQKAGPIQAKVHTVPIAAIVLAVLAFIVLSALAYYAYRKG